jgi:predicted enzyme related to lactoylglutathione lyase
MLAKGTYGYCTYLLGGRPAEIDRPGVHVRSSPHPARMPGGKLAGMGERTSYTPGTFSWTDLTTTDQDAAKAFYGELFGWEAIDNPVGDGVVYSMMQIDGKDVAAISPQNQQQREMGAPPAWNSYITVESADETLEKAKQLGGSVHAPAFDVMDVGRMGVVQDPQGAYFLAWQAKTHVGAALVNAPGALSWNELATTDPEASAAFYAELFGWTAEPFEGSAMPYWTIANKDGHTNGGIRPAMEQEPTYWLVYFGSADIDADVAKVSELGGSQIVEPMDIGVGKIGVAQDPQGAVFALYAGQFEP